MPIVLKDNCNIIPLMSFLKNGIDFNPEAKTYKIQYCKAGASTTAWVSRKIPHPNGN